MRVYIASPFFNEEEISRVKRMEKLLEGRGYDVYSPMRDGIVLTPDATLEQRLSTYRENVDEVMKCDLLLAITATRDTGTSVEHGVKIGQWETIREVIRSIHDNDPELLSNKEKLVLEQETPRIITFADNDRPANVMLLGAVLRHCSSWDELSEYLDYVDSVGIEKAVRNAESIEDVKVY